MVVEGTEPEPALLKDLHTLELPADLSDRRRRLETVSDLNSRSNGSPLKEPGAAAPFRGLEAYDEGSSRFFFGRGQEIREIIRRFGGRCRWLHIEGASGSGKSSLARAGILPAVRRGWVRGLHGVSPWILRDLRPGRNPLRSLAEAVGALLDEAGVKRIPQEEIEARLDRDPRALAEVLTAVSEALESQCLLLLDQVEELFTLVDEEQPDVGQFDLLLATALGDPDLPFYLVTTVRNDFQHLFLERLPLLQRILNRPELCYRYSLAQMEEDGLREVLQAPLRLADLCWQDAGLPERILGDLFRDLNTDDAAPGGGLPLLSFTLRSLWEGSPDGSLSEVSYQALGGVTGALTHKADTLVEGLGEDQHGRIRDLLLRLVRVDVDRESDTRRTLTREEALEAAGGDERAQEVLLKLSGGRLRDGSPAGLRLLICEGDHVDLVHEELLRSWGRLRDWIEEDRDLLICRDQLMRAALQWEEQNCPEDGLPGAKMVEYYQPSEGMAGPAAQHYLAAAHWRNRLSQAQEDLYLILGLPEDLEKYWPLGPSLLGAYDRWVTSAESVLRRLSVHQETLSQIRLRARGASRLDGRESWVFDSEDDAAWPSTLVEVIERFQAAGDPRHGLLSGIHPEHGWGILKRRDFAGEIEERSIRGAEAAGRWREAIASIADREACPTYKGLTIEPQLGLLPLGRNPRSGLWEFVHLQTGEAPERHGERLEMTVQSTVVLVLLPGGDFWMGAETRADGPNHDPEAREGEAPVHRVSLDPFFLGKYEMTQGQWTRLQGSNPAYWNPEMKEAKPPFTLVHPVENVSWDDGVRILRRGDLELPTEAQWEYAARAGSAGPYPFEATAMERYLNVRDQAYAATYRDGEEHEAFDGGWARHAPVGSFEPNPFGLHEMNGNVWEWCRDAYAPYSADPSAHRAGDGLRKEEGRFRVTRGGSFFERASAARSSYRDKDPADRKAYHLGVRASRQLRRS